MTDPKSINDLLVGGITPHGVWLKPGGRETIIILSTISCYNVIELVVLVFFVFRRWGSFYFWSLLVTACLGVAPYTLGACLGVFLRLGRPCLSMVTMLSVFVMVNGHSFVLYSRLHLVISDDRRLRAALFIIVIDMVLQIPTMGLVWGWYMTRNAIWYRIYHIVAKISIAVLTFQETILSAAYIWETIRILRLGSTKAHARILYELITIGALIFFMDLVGLSLELTNCYATHTAVRGPFYSIKLKLELAVLRKLADVARNQRQPTEIVEQGLRLCSPEPFRHPTATTVSSNSIVAVN